MVSAKGRWGDLLEDEEELPAPTTTGPDAKGIVTRVEYSRNDKGEVVKRTIKSRVVKIEKRVYQSALDRQKSWKKFGDAAGERSTDAVTSRSTEEVMLERLRPQKQTQEDKSKVDFHSAMATSSNSLIVGSLKDMLAKRRMERQLLAAKGLIAAPERPPTEEEGAGGLGRSSGPSGGGWVPPSLRNRMAGGGDAGPDRRRDENSLRVNNLSEDADEESLRKLFGKIGNTTRIFVARDRETGESRGFGFVTYSRYEDAARAIQMLDGHGYDNLILSVEWATPREPR